MKMIRRVLLVCFLSLPATMFGAVLSGPIYNPATTHSYYLISSNLWGAAEVEAQSLGGHLVTINNSAENAWVLSTFGNFNGIQSPLWLGLNDEAAEGNYVWTSGETPSYFNWNGGEPNDYGGEDHVAMRGLDLAPGADTWNDVPFGDVYYGVVEVPEPTATALLLASAAAFVARRKFGTP